MMITQWKQIRSLFESVCDLDPEEREARLSATCAGDPELRAEVESLLTASEEAIVGLDVPAAETFREVIRSDEAERLVGGRVGAYQLVRLIACGGMGSVYYATPRDDPHGQPVAVKLIAPRLRLSDDIVRRFHREQRTLAKLDHPNIGRLLDGGVAEGDTPYLVMEFVDGAPIDQFCDEHRLSISKRLVLFRAVCAAVQFAHRNLVVHRDLKPSNILVTPNGVPKLLDFGIAKLIEEDPDRALETTLDGPRLMTPAYASPEQLRGHTITTASDVYSLGVILYELLTGHRPYNLTTRSLHEVERVICESNPKKPSTAILETTLPRGPEGATAAMVTPDTVSRARSDTPDALRRRLAGDLDAIVLVAMRKEPERRYASVELFSEDIRRYLDGMPVSARRDTVRYRCAKFARRNKTGLIAGTVVLLAALGVLFNTVHSEHRARRDAAKTQQVNRFLNEMFASVGMGITAKSQPTVRRVLDGAADKLATGALSGQPEVEAAVRMTIGATYLELGLYDLAEPHLTTALEIRLAKGSNRDVGVADSLEAMGLLNKEMGRYDQAERFYRESLETRRDLFGADHLSTAETMNNLGVLLRKRGRLEEAEHLLRGALHVRRTQLGNADEAVATTSTNLGAVLKNLGRLDEAESLYRDAVDIFRAVLGDNDYRLAACLNNLALLLRERCDYVEAVELLHESADIRRNVFGERHPAYATGLHNLALLLADSGEYAEAEIINRQALTIRRDILPADHPHLAYSLNNLAHSLCSQGKLDEAEPLCLEALAIRTEKLGTDHRLTGSTLMLLGRIVAESGDPATAEPLLREASSIAHKRLPPGHRKLAEVMGELGSCLIALHRYEEAEVLLLDAYQIVLAAKGAPQSLTTDAVHRLVRLYEKWAKPEEAARFARLLPRDPDDR